MSASLEIPPALITAATAGDDAAARELIEQLYPHIVGIVRRHLPRHECEEDICQDVFIRIFRSLSKYRGDKPFHHWARKIATNTCVDALRKCGRRPVLQHTDLTDEQLNGLSSHFSVECATAGLAAVDLVEHLLATLKPTEQVVIRLLDLSEMSVADVVLETGWSASKVKVTAMRARRKLRATLTRLERPHPTIHHHERPDCQGLMDIGSRRRTAGRV